MRPAARPWVATNAPITEEANHRPLRRTEDWCALFAARP
jgi:hypothetical protein